MSNNPGAPRGGAEWGERPEPEARGAKCCDGSFLK
jgi:hypothetical protein